MSARVSRVTRQPPYQARPDQVGRPLVRREGDVAAAYVLVEAQLTAWPQHPVELPRSAARGSGTRAQQPRQPRRRRPNPSSAGIAPAVPSTTRHGHGAPRPRPRRRVSRRNGSGSTATTSADPRPGTPAVQALAGADLDHPAGQAGEHLAAELAVAPLLVASGEPVVPAGEERIVDWRHHRRLPDGPAV